MNKSSIVTTDCISHAYEFCINPIVVIIVRCTAFLVLVSWIKRSRLFWRLLSMPLVMYFLMKPQYSKFSKNSVSLPLSDIFVAFNISVLVIPTFLVAKALIIIK